MTTLNLKEHEFAQCHVNIHDDGTIDFISYTTLVIRATPDSENEEIGMYDLYCTGTYSRTTAKQIGWFLREYFNDANYYDMKRIAGTGELMAVRLTKWR